MHNPKKEILLYIGDTMIGDINKFTKNRQLSEYLKSEQMSPSCDQFTFDINWKNFQDFITSKFNESPDSFLKVGKTRVIFKIDGRIIRFAGWLSSRPARIGFGANQILSLKFFEYFARLSGDLVCDPQNPNSPFRRFENRPAHLYVQDLINNTKSRAAAAGETLKWDYGKVKSLANKTKTYKDFQTVAKALCDAMNNTSGAGKFDVTFRTDPEDYTHQFIDILAPRGRRKNIIIQYPGDGVYKLWSSDYTIDETNEYASDVVVSGNGQIGDPAADENTAEIASRANIDFVKDYCYFRFYSSQSNLESKQAVSEYAKTLLGQLSFKQENPQISLIGRPIDWGDETNDNNGLAIGDEFCFIETNNDGANQSGWFRIVALETSYDDLGVETVKPTLVRTGEV